MEEEVNKVGGGRKIVREIKKGRGKERKEEMRQTRKEGRGQEDIGFDGRFVLLRSDRTGKSRIANERH